MLRIGIDVGGTNTDAALMDGDSVVAVVKRPTSADVTSGVVEAIESVLASHANLRSKIQAVMIGTTHFVNAVVQRRAISKVGIIRIGLPMGSAIPPMVDWPGDLKSTVDGGCHLIHGGAYFNGEEYATLDTDAVLAAAKTLRERGCKAVAISCVFAPIRPDIEETVADLVRTEIPEAAVTLSHQVGGLGLIERENSAILNACLSELAESVVSGLQRAIADTGLNATLYVSHNDGTLLDGEQVRKFPVFACAAGPTNSIRGAAFLTGLDEAIVVDVGGTTTDVGILVKGLARETSAVIELGGVKTNFAMADVLSIALGGGTIVDLNIPTSPCLTSKSVGFQLSERSRVFGGDTLTTTDIAVANGWLDVGTRDGLEQVSEETRRKITADIQTRMADAIDQVKLSGADIPVIVVGGGAPLVDKEIDGASKVIKPEFSGAANAIGAAIAQVGGRVKRLFDYGSLGGRDAAIQLATQEAKQAAIESGAVPASLKVVEIEELPMPYMNTGATSLGVRVVGDLAPSRGTSHT